MKQIFDGIETEESNMNIDANKNEVTTSLAIASINDTNASRNSFQSSLQSESISNSTTLQAQTNKYSLYTMNSVNQAYTNATTDDQWIYLQ